MFIVSSGKANSVHVSIEGQMSKKQYSVSEKLNRGLKSEKYLGILIKQNA